MSSGMRLAERYLYSYKSDCIKIERLSGRLRMLEEHGDLVYEGMKGMPRIERLRKGAEDWYIKCEELRERISELSYRVESIGEFRGMMRERGRYTIRYAVMSDILERVYIERIKFAEYIRERGMSQRTAYRRKNELLIRACEYLEL